MVDLKEESRRLIAEVYGGRTLGEASGSETVVDGDGNRLGSLMRGMNGGWGAAKGDEVRVFKTRDDAEAWLRGEAPKPKNALFLSVLAVIVGLGYWAMSR